MIFKYANLEHPSIFKNDLIETKKSKVLCFLLHHPPPKKKENAGQVNTPPPPPKKKPTQF